MPENETMTTKEVLEYLGISRPTLYKRIEEGVLRPLPGSNAVRKKPALEFDRAAVERLKKEGL